MTEQAVRLVHITKRFSANAVQALDGADLTIREGEIHALIGENGAGKSTLMHILAGYMQPSSGRIIVHAAERRFRSPREALDSGIGMVRQHPALVSGLRVWEHCILGAERDAVIRPAAQRTRLRELCDQWDFDLPLDHPADSLSVSQRQYAALINLLLRNCRILIFDEITAVISRAEAERLFTLFNRLKERGFSLIVISHKLDEVLSSADRITVLRSGETVASIAAENAGIHALNALMFGSRPAPAAAHSVPDVRSASAAAHSVLLSVKDLMVEAPDKPSIRHVSMEIRANTITGIAGVRDSGLETLEYALAGMIPRTSGAIVLNNTALPLGKRDDLPAVFRAAGMAYLNADRTNVCLAMNRPLWDNLVIHAHRRQPVCGFFLNKPLLDAWARSIMARAGSARSSREPASSFSGGQLQRLLIERERAEIIPAETGPAGRLSSRPSAAPAKPACLFIVSEPAWGLDARARKTLADTLRSMVNGTVETGTASEGGVSIALFSTDIDALLEVSDEILVLNSGSISARIAIADRANSAALREYKTRVMQAMTSAAPLSTGAGL
ncbi:MAG: ATP-binding cassette domain-containing protein [Treponema sp.]|jgi:simple sugar transport system ATP-binding protein|nr:ATP-binding cassette domain-containing protein [Treponema sp.]